MSISPWTVVSLPTVEWYLPESAGMWPAFTEAGVSVVERPASLFAGSALWMGELGLKPVALAWDWLELRKGVVALADPNGIVSNLRFLSDEETYRTPAESTIAKARLVCAMPWQASVVRAIEARRSGARTSRPRRLPAAYAGEARAAMQELAVL